MIGAWLLQHFVEETGASGSLLGVLAICHSHEVVIRPTLFPLATLLFLFGVLGARGLGGLGFLLPLGVTIGEDRPNCLFA